MTGPDIGQLAAEQRRTNALRITATLALLGLVGMSTALVLGGKPLVMLMVGGGLPWSVAGLVVDSVHTRIKGHPARGAAVAGLPRNRACGGSLGRGGNSARSRTW